MRQSLLSFLLFIATTSIGTAQSYDSLLLQLRTSKPAADSILVILEPAKTDSITLVHYSALYNISRYSFPQLSYRFASKEYDLALRLNYTPGQAMALFHKGSYHEIIGQLDSAQYYYNRSITLFREMGDTQMVPKIKHSLAALLRYDGQYQRAADLYRQNIAHYSTADTQYYAVEKLMLAGVYQDMGYYRLGLQEALDAVRILQKNTKKPYYTADAFYQIAALEHAQNNRKQAIDYYQQALTIYDSIQDYSFSSSTLVAMANIFAEQNQLKKAESNFLKAKAIAEKNSFHQVLANSLLGLADLKFKEGNNLEALKMQEQGMKILLDNGFSSEYYQAHIELANYTKGLGNLTKAIKQLSIPIDSLAESIPLQSLSRAYKLRAQINEERRLPEASLQDYKQYSILNDSIFSLTKLRQMEELQAIYQTQQKEEAIRHQQQAIVLLEKEQAISQYQKIVLAALLLVAALGLGLLFMRIKQHRLKQERIQQELAYKNKELTTHALHLAKKNELLNDIHSTASSLTHSDTGYKQIARAIKFDKYDDNHWDDFMSYFEQVHIGFNNQAKNKFPELTQHDLRLMALLKMNLSSKEISTILNISPDGIKKARQRLRKKMQLEPSESLENTVQNI